MRVLCGQCSCVWPDSAPGTPNYKTGATNPSQKTRHRSEMSMFIVRMRKAVICAAV